MSKQVRVLRGPRSSSFVPSSVPADEVLNLLLAFHALRASSLPVSFGRLPPARSQMLLLQCSACDMEMTSCFLQSAAAKMAAAVNKLAAHGLVCMKHRAAIVWAGHLWPGQDMPHCRRSGVQDTCAAACEEHANGSYAGRSGWDLRPPLGCCRANHCADARRVVEAAAHKSACVAAAGCALAALQNIAASAGLGRRRPSGSGSERRIAWPGPARARASRHVALDHQLNLELCSAALIWSAASGRFVRHWPRWH